MNIEHIQFELRRRRLDEIFDFAVIVLRNYPLLFFRYVAPPIAAFLCFNTAAIGFLRGTIDQAEEFGSLGPNLLMLFVLLVEQSALRLPLILVNGRLLFQKAVLFSQVREDFRAVGGGFVLRTVLVRNLFLFVLWPRYFFLPEVLALERAPAAQLRQRLANLTRRQSDRIIGFRFITGALGLLYILVGMYVWSGIREIPGLQFTHWILSGDLNLLAPAVHLLFLTYAVYHATARFLFYIDTRSVLEGWDIEKMLIKGMRESTESV